jgi:glucan-binding YG repeat protein
MTLEELLAALESLKADAEKDPENEELKAKVTEAQAAYDAKKAEETDPDVVDETKLDAKTQAHIAKLRKEAASHRTKGKDLASKLKASEDQKKAILKAAGIEEEPNPEEKIKSLSAGNEQLASRAAVLEAAVEHGIPKAKLKYFQFLIQEAVGELAEGDELPEEKLAEIVKECKGGGKTANTNVEDDDNKGDGKKPPPKPDTGGSVNLTKFCSMSITEKSDLYQKKPDLYNALVAEAKAKKKLV